MDCECDLFDGRCHLVNGECFFGGSKGKSFLTRPIIVSFY